MEIGVCRVLRTHVQYESPGSDKRRTVYGVQVNSGANANELLDRSVVYGAIGVSNALFVEAEEEPIPNGRQVACLVSLVEVPIDFNELVVDERHDEAAVDIIAVAPSNREDDLRSSWEGQAFKYEQWGNVGLSVFALAYGFAIAGAMAVYGLVIVAYLLGSILICCVGIYPDQGWELPHRHRPPPARRGANISAPIQMSRLPAAQAAAGEEAVPEEVLEARRQQAAEANDTSPGIGDFVEDEEHKANEEEPDANPLAEMLTAKKREIDSKTKQQPKPAAQSKRPPLPQKLYEAAEHGRTEKVCQLLVAGGEPNWVNGFGNSALLQASRKGYADIVRLLLHFGADKTITSTSHRTALSWAEENQHAEVIQLLTSTTPVRANDLLALYSDGVLPKKQSAPGQGQSKNVSRDEKRKFFEYVEHGVVKRVSEMLVDERMKRVRCFNGKSALHVAALHGRARLVDVLIAEHGADIDEVDNSKFTALMYAARSGHEAVVQKLLEHHVDTDKQARSGKTAADFAAEIERDDIVDMLTVSYTHLTLPTIA
eukprot:TRINITY_DN8988_c0_g1_i1.p1 TRINITY_DN8988_c0_g1~~TRINITY_DN8988_c0_g1_i1.p1  ORF type:complete len:614 (-),score=146.05 TRINITY_DN8988_c0_g1_i1:1-1626(-)